MAAALPATRARSAAAAAFRPPLPPPPLALRGAAPPHARTRAFAAAAAAAARGPPRLDFRSDTVTKPTGAMYRAIADAQVGDDVYGEDPTADALERNVARLCGHEAGLFCVSGTMTNQVRRGFRGPGGRRRGRARRPSPLRLVQGVPAFARRTCARRPREARLSAPRLTRGPPKRPVQIALRAHLTQPPHSVLCDQRAHVYRHEAGGISYHSQASVTAVSPRNGRYLTAEDVADNLLDDDVHHAPTRVVSLENTLNGTVSGSSCGKKKRKSDVTPPDAPPASRRQPTVRRR
ncbi:MAG: pyridoxal phosphate-dependent transferase [Olpidium bornovanus]|uniref:Pyridoxal phosphate-dependent transferase n=1 Tax=Olpidium bornovanus TaxID=278681 RepID=A0A8H7ZW70_9FUNG|nr:MAG: pyridoxal phosphate-dependent transferase [Olpidium bornovanus]